MSILSTLILIFHSTFASESATHGYQLRINEFGQICRFSKTHVQCWGGEPSDAKIDILGYTDVTDVAMNSKTTYVIDDGFLWRYGYVPEDEPKLIKPTDIESGNDHFCAIDEGFVKCWGDGFSSAAEVPEDLGVVDRISLGSDLSCAQKGSTVRCWGEYVGNFGTPSKFENVLDMVAGGYRVCILFQSGEIECWSHGDTFNRGPDRSQKDLKEMSIGFNNICARQDDGVHCKGEWRNKIDLSRQNEFLNFQIGGDTFCGQTKDRLICSGWKVEEVKGIGFEPRTLNDIKLSGFSNVGGCVVDGLGMYCFGVFPNEMSKLKDSKDIQSIAVGKEHSCAIVGQVVECWGREYRGEKYLLEKLKNPKKLYAPTADGYNFCALDDEGVSCWGDRHAIGLLLKPRSVNFEMSIDGNTYCYIDAGVLECLGDVTNPIYKYPFDLNSPSHLSLSAQMGCVVDLGKLRCWGKSDDARSDFPSDLGEIFDVFVGPSNICATTKSGIRCWGDLDTEINNIQTGFLIPDKLFVGAQYACAINNGELFCWGRSKPNRPRDL
ncbi:MAG: hypothetical protein KDD25_08690 [Bdellovibrionales bacterium]|nr:hypothetical protein [Bdellovibrionales bacterium]